jgi:RNA polymerase sigma-70 factor (ECF subfamily)
LAFSIFRNKNLKSFSDLELILKFKENGDNIYIGEVFERYTHLVFGVCLKYLKDHDESKDAVMQIFEKLIDDLKKHEVTNFKSWLHSVAKNHCLMFLRTQKSVSLKNEEFKIHSNQFMESDEVLHLFEENKTEKEISNLGEAMKELNKEQKLCVELFYLREKSYQEVSEETGFTMNQVKSFIQNGKRNLKIYLTNNSDNE